MRNRKPLQSLLLCAVSVCAIFPVKAQDGQGQSPVFRVEVDMVLLQVAVTDNKGNYITGLRPWDFKLYEDGVEQKMATFGEGNEAPRSIADFTPGQNPQQLQIVRPYRGANANPARPQATETAFAEATADRIASLVAGASVFVLFDTSNYMYEGFVYAQDAIADFIRSLDNPDSVALYSYSRDFSRAAPLTSDRHRSRG